MSVGAYVLSGGDKEKTKNMSMAYNLSGMRGADAAQDAAAEQKAAAAQAIAFQRETRDLARADLSPFVNFATGSVDQYDANNYANLPIPETRENFDAAAYIAANPEVGDPKKWDPRSHDAFDHYQMYGRNEGRQFTPIAGAARSGASGGRIAAQNSPLAMLARMLTPQGQMDYLQQNPLFDLALNNANRQSNNAFLGRGKVGDATGQLVNNAYLAGAPLLQQQTGNLFNAANLGQASAAGQANTSSNAGMSISDLITSAGNAGAAGTIGAANAGQQGASNAVGIIGALGSLFSDRRLKRNITKHGRYGEYDTYKYQYIWSDDWFIGVMSDDVRRINPAAVSVDKSGYDVVNYGVL